MTYNQARVYECCRTGIGATTVEIIRNCHIAPANVVMALSSMLDEGWVSWSNINGQRYFTETEKGKEAYSQWSDIPF